MARLTPWGISTGAPARPELGEDTALVNAHRPRPRFAQHFLVARGVIEAIAGLVRPAAGEVVLEIGPGRGALTEVLLAAVGRLVAVEIDRDLAALLRARQGTRAGCT